MTRRTWKRRAGIALGAVVLALLALYVVFGGGRAPTAGDIVGPRLPVEVVSARDTRNAEALPEGADPDQTRILFGDLHVHTTFSADAFMRSLPLMGGEGAHPPADACDFARHCSQLDFFALTDHAEMLTPRLWRESKQSVRDCNALAEAGGTEPDLVAFTGFEWTQVGTTPEEHYGHKNVIFHGTAEEELPARAIASSGLLQRAFSAPGGIATLVSIPITEFSERQAYLDIGEFFRENMALDTCPTGPSPGLPAECREYAETPAVLFRKLDEWGLDALVIPHGTTWGFYTPPGYTWDKQLDPAQDSPRQGLVEVYSGHGNSEEYRPTPHVLRNDDGTHGCPAPTDAFEPCCHRAGELIRARCAAAGESETECETRAATARSNYANAGVAGHHTVPGATVEEWGNCGQCTDCFEPSFMSRFGGSVQYALARGHFEEGQTARHATWGFIASSDNHGARPGTGYKPYDRRQMTEASGFVDQSYRDRIFGAAPERVARSRAVDDTLLSEIPAFAVVDLERQASFFMTGGLVAVHATARSRDAIWEALRARRVYGTSGDRILLWFDIVDGDGTLPMGSVVSRGAAPTFRVRAAGSFEQIAGCPPDRIEALGSARFERVCRGECYHPGDRRRRIERIEVVRIRPQEREDEPIAGLIDDPFLVLPCPPGRAVCEQTFSDPGYGERDAVYYVRAIQETTSEINAGGLRCEGGVCRPCHGDYRTDVEDDCAGPSNERAWASPIYVRWDASLVPPPTAVTGDEGANAGGTARAPSDE
ncbi:MAG: DUF3604 domain-containing protein [Polyangiales bacterium]